MKKNLFRTAVAISSLCAAAFVQPAHAAWPDDKPIELIVGFAPGGGTDVMARTLARFMEPRLGEKARIIVVNRPGAGGEIAANHVQNAAPDGYTLGMINVPGYVFLPMYRKTSYQPENIRLLARIVDDPAMLVAHKDGGKPLTLEAFVEQSRKHPDSLTVGHPGDGTTGHLGILQLSELADIEINAIPFKGAGESKVALQGRHVDYIMITTGEAVEMTQTGSAMTGVALWAAERAQNNVPTAKEAGYAVEVSSERGMGAPKDLPDDIAARIEAAIEETLKDPAF